MATATEEQSSVANEINMNLDSVNTSIMEGTQASQELALTSKNLEALAQRLDHHVGAFKV